MEENTSAAIRLAVKTAPTLIQNKLQIGSTSTIALDVSALEKELRSSIEGEVRFSDGDRGLYASDAGNYRMAPVGVVLPRNVDDVLQTLAACRRHGAPIVARGGGTGIPGQSVNVAVLLDFSKYMNQILQLDPKERFARVQPGVVLDDLRHASNQYGLTFGPDPATHDRCTLGGMIGNNSCGVHSMMAGKTADNIEELDIVLYDGTRLTVGATSEAEFEKILRCGGRKEEIYRKLRNLCDRYRENIRNGFPKIPRWVSGYNLPALLPENGFHVAKSLVGSESTCALIVEAKTKLVENPQFRSLLVLGYPDIFTAADNVTDVAKYGPIGLEALDGIFFEYMKRKGLHPQKDSMLPDGDAWLFAEFGGGDKSEADAKAQKYIDELKRRTNAPSVRLFDDPEQEKHVWHLREEGLGASAKIPAMPENHEGWEDSAVPPEQLGNYLRDLKKLMDEFDYEGPLYGHFGQGCVHTRLTFDLESKPGIAKFRQFVERAADLVVSYGGSLSGEHGDGQARGELLGKMYSPEIMQAFQEFKSIWDPDWKMNPGKVVAPYRVDENLRLGADYAPMEPETHFHFPQDHYSFAYASERCVGAGVCRRHEGGTMCPSYMVTRDEKHSTRGRARLLSEMLRGEILKNGWRNKDVHEALDLCLSCKGCKHDCPVQVDMATYKAEFLSHYYERRIRPRHAYASGLIDSWARAASHMPAIANFFTQSPVFARIAKFAAGYAQEREIPRFAPETFKKWYSRRGSRNQGKPEVILWADTFNNYFTPAIGRAAVEVLEQAGYQVLVFKQPLCCGRPLYDYGMLDKAAALLSQILQAARSAIRAGIPIIGLEPSCVSVFRDELRNLFPHDEDAKRLHDQCYMLSEFLHDRVPNYRPPSLRRKAVIHGHCHHKSVLHFEKETNLLKRMGLECNVLDAGCCGMAGSFGYEVDHYSVGLACGERALLPSVRQANPEELIVTDGFSCREMIRQETDREALHFAQVLQMALHEGPNGSVDLPVEKPYSAVERTPALPISVVAATLLAGAGIWWGLRRSRN